MKPRPAFLFSPLLFVFGTKGYAITMALIFPAGIPATYVAVLYLGRSRINPDPLNPAVSTEKREADPTIQKTK